MIAMRCDHFRTEVLYSCMAKDLAMLRHKTLDEAMIIVTFKRLKADVFMYEYQQIPKSVRRALPCVHADQ